MATQFSISILIGVFSYALYLYNYGSRLTPDGNFYLSMGRGNPAPTPYRYRWLLSRLLGPRVRLWNVVTGVSLVLTCPLIAMLGGEQWLPAVLLWVGLPWFRLGVRYPVLTDATAMLFALLSVILLPVSIPLAVVSAVIAGTCRESAPVYAALFSLSPWPLLAMPAVLAAHFLTKKGEIPIGADWLHKPFKSAWDFHGGKWLDAKWTLLPWGAALIAVLNPQFWTALPALAVAYGTMLVANDFARLYQWAAPPVVILAAQMVPELSIIGVGFTIFALILPHFWNPYANIDV